ncbi:hypothetical protein F4782DRAFT_490540 [Xylaria castorea]|nr:hypothetical protein F4782DRAFT_490540 [Xylaria castorea]
MAACTILILMYLYLSSSRAPKDKPKLHSSPWDFVLRLAGEKIYIIFNSAAYETQWPCSYLQCLLKTVSLEAYEH